MAPSGAFHTPLTETKRGAQASRSDQVAGCIYRPGHVKSVISKSSIILDSFMQYSVIQQPHMRTGAFLCQLIFKGFKKGDREKCPDQRKQRHFSREVSLSYSNKEYDGPKASASTKSISDFSMGRLVIFSSQSERPPPFHSTPSSMVHYAAPSIIRRGIVRRSLGQRWVSANNRGKGSGTGIGKRKGTDV